MTYRTLSPRPRPPAPQWLALPASRACGGPEASGERQSRSPQPRTRCQTHTQAATVDTPGQGRLALAGTHHVVNRPEFNVSPAHRHACIGSAERPGIELAPLYSRFTRPGGHRPEGMTATLTWPRSSDTCTTRCQRSAPPCAPAPSPRIRPGDAGSQQSTTTARSESGTWATPCREPDTPPGNEGEARRQPSRLHSHRATGH
jgi:hypothetical protein